MPKTDKPNQAQILIELALTSGIKLFTNQYGEPVMSLPESPFMVQRLDSSHTYNLINKLFWDDQGKPSYDTAIKSAITTLKGLAQYDSPTIQVYNRVALSKNVIYYDFADNKHAAVINADGWKITTEVPVYFQRYSHQKPQILPTQNGSISQIFDFVNVNESDQLLVMTYLVVSLVQDIPRAILLVQGDQGSAKSTMLKMFRELIDPSQVPIPAPPSNDEELIHIANQHYMVCLDNLSRVTTSMSDALCRLVTGDGYQKRKLYTDDDMILYFYKRVVALAGINQVAEKADLLDRSIMVSLERISDDRRREEKQLWQDFAAAKPSILGALFAALSAALRTAETLDIVTKPRMADYFRYSAAVAIHLGKTEKDLVEAFHKNTQQQNEEAIDASSVAQAVIEFMEDKPHWNGTSTQLYEQLITVAEKLKIDRGFPKPTWLWKRILEVRPNLVTFGIGCTKRRTKAAAQIELTKGVGSVGNVSKTVGEMDNLELQQALL